MRNPLNRLHATKQGRGARRRRAGRMSMVPFVVALAVAGCGDQGSGDMGQPGVADETTAMEGTMAEVQGVGVSIMEGGRVIPILPAGLTSITVDNTGREDCTLSFEPLTGGDAFGEAGYGERADDPAYGAGQRAGQAADQTADELMAQPQGEAGDAATQDGAQPQTSTPDATDADGDSQDDASGQATTRNLSTKTVTAGQVSTMSIDLAPGLYQMSCTDETRAELQQTEDPLLVMITDGQAMQGRRGAAPNSGADDDSDGPAGVQ